MNIREKSRIAYISGKVLGSFGIIYVKEIIYQPPSGRIRRKAIFKCFCGKIFEARISSIKSDHTKSCGCIHKKHGLSNSKLYSLWKRVKKRCYNKNSHKYYRYGARGITIYKPWLDNPAKFCNYVKGLLNFGEVGRTLDRINNDGNYEPGNLRWATTIEQANNKSNNKKVFL